MKKFRFRLDTVQRVRQIQHDVARGDLMSANHQLALAAQLVAARAIKASTIDAPTAAMTSEQFAQHRFAIDSAFDAIRWAQRDEATATEVVAERRTEWVSTHTRLRAVERLHDRARAEYRDEYRREADRDSDEITTTRFRERSLPR